MIRETEKILLMSLLGTDPCTPTSILATKAGIVAAIIIETPMSYALSVVVSGMPCYSVA